MNWLWKSPILNLLASALFVLLVAAAAAGAYVANGWSLGDAVYMVIITVYTVGYGEVRPIDTHALRLITEALTVLGCTGMICLSAALVQFITFTTLQQLVGTKRMKNQIAALTGHVIIVGFGRIGLILARDLAKACTPFVVIERTEDRLTQARHAGYLCYAGDATDEEVLIAAGIERAAYVVTVTPNDAANVFITLSARALNPKLDIIARGEDPATEGKLRQAGANQVVLPAHIGAERVAEIILNPTAATLLRQGERRKEIEQDFNRLGLSLETLPVEESGRYAFRTIAEVESLSLKNCLIISVTHPDGSTAGPDPALRLMPGDAITLMRRG
jgi:voltage-gated potassium channel Kch